MIRFFTEDVVFSLPQKLAVKKWLAAQTLAEGHQLGDLNFVFASDEYVMEVNREHLNHDYYTDIITFDNREHPTDPLEGDIFISTERVADNAAQLGLAPDQEMRRVMAHGLLHLCGFGDKSEADQAVMRQKEEAWLAGFGA